MQIQSLQFERDQAVTARREAEDANIIAKEEHKRLKALVISIQEWSGLVDVR